MQEIFAAALELNGAERREYLASACGPDSELLRQTLQLLDDHDRVGEFLAEPAIRLSPENVNARLFHDQQVIAGRFRIVRLIARGGMGEVYEAEDLRLGQGVALKTVQAHLAHDAFPLLLQEVDSARRVSHPNVCRIHDIVEHGDPPVLLLTMQLLTGPTLAERLREHGPFSRHEALSIIQQMAAGLQAAHDVGVVHRDFKPGNVILTRSQRGWRPVITDFGLALSPISSPRSMIKAGTPGYMAPEQREGGLITPAADIYAIGLVIAAMAGARRSAISNPSSPDASNPLTVEEYKKLGPWRGVVRRCLEKEPAKRYQRPADVAAALSRRWPKLLPDGVAPLAFRSRRRPAVIGAVALVMAVGGVLRLNLRLGHPSETPPSPARSKTPLKTGQPVNSSIAREVVAPAAPAPASTPSSSILPGSDGTATTSVRVVSAADTHGILGPSGDGSYLLQLSDSGLSLLDLNTRQTRLVAGGRVDYARSSADGRQIAFLRFGDRTPELWAVNADGRGARLLFRHRNGPAKLLGWSSDKKQVLAVEPDGDGQCRVVSVSAAGGLPSTLVEGPCAELGTADLSPTALHIVFAKRVRKNPPQDELWLLSLPDRRADLLLQSPGTVHSPLWTPNGDGVLFKSDQREPEIAQDLWLLRVTGRKPEGIPELLRGGMEKVDSLGPVTRDGSYFYRQTTDLVQTFTAAFDPETGRVVGQPAPLSHSAGDSMHPSCSRDGRWLAYWRHRRDHLVLVMHSVPDGMEREVATPFTGGATATFFSGGSSLLVVGLDPGNGAGFYRMDTATGESTLLKSGGARGLIDLSPDGRTVYYSRYGTAQVPAHVVAWEIETGQERELLAGEGTVNPGAVLLALSPDGRQLAVTRVDQKDQVIEILPSVGGTRREVHRVHEPEVLGSVLWTPDSRYLIFSHFQTKSGRLQLQRIPVDGGQPHDIGLELSAMGKAVIHPDGRHLTYAVNLSTGGIWALQNFLPGLRAHK